MPFPGSFPAPEEEEKGIFFHEEDIDFSLPDDPDILIRWLEDILAQEDKHLHRLTYIFCSDEYLYRLNVDYLQHDTYTDIITFPYGEEIIEGDLFISIERVRENAATLGVPFEQELRRVMAHGLLHLCGYGDKTPAEQQQMRQKEESCLSLW
jgi:rRNA maturation RNase YbeY